MGPNLVCLWAKIDNQPQWFRARRDQQQSHWILIHRAVFSSGSLGLRSGTRSINTAGGRCSPGLWEAGVLVRPPSRHGYRLGPGRADEPANAFAATLARS